MILINEWLPNPAGADAAGEWIEIVNGGSAAARLDGWSIGVSSRKTFNLSGKTIEAGGFLVVKRSESKLILKNIDETVRLYDARGNIADQSAFLGSAPEGKSFSRAGLEEVVRQFVFSAPTPGAPNEIAHESVLIATRYPEKGGAFEHTVGGGGMWLMMIIGAIAITAIVFFIAKQNDYFKELFFGRN